MAEAVSFSRPQSVGCATKGRKSSMQIEHYKGALQVPEFFRLFLLRAIDAPHSSQLIPIDLLGIGGGNRS